MDRIQWKRNTMAPSSDKFLSVMDVREIKKAKSVGKAELIFSASRAGRVRNIKKKT